MYKWNNIWESFLSEQDEKQEDSEKKRKIKRTIKYNAEKLAYIKLPSVWHNGDAGISSIIGLPLSLNEWLNLTGEIRPLNHHKIKKGVARGGKGFVYELENGLLLKLFKQPRKAIEFDYIRGTMSDNYSGTGQKEYPNYIAKGIAESHSIHWLLMSRVIPLIDLWPEKSGGLDYAIDAARQIANKVFGEPDMYSQINKLLKEFTATVFSTSQMLGLIETIVKAEEKGIPIYRMDLNRHNIGIMKDLETFVIFDI